MKAAIQAARILQTASFSDLVFACGQVRERLGVASPLSELTMQSDSAGRISLGAGDRTADLSGQFRLDLEDNPPTVSVLLADAEDARETGESGQAVQLLRRVLAASPKNLDALFELGSLLCEEDQFSEGIALLRKAAALRPGFADAWYNIGHALERQGRRAEAREAYARAVTADPTYPDPLYNLGMIELDDARYREAVDWLQAYLALDGDSEWATKARKALALARMSLVKAAG
jgi:Flp pilus assembly protein TadD